MENIVVALISAVASISGAWFAMLASKRSKDVRQTADQINDAVNHRHEKNGNGLKLYDLVWENHKKVDELVEWRRGYQAVGLLDTPEKVSDFCEEVHSRIEELEKQFDEEEK